MFSLPSRNTPHATDPPAPSIVAKDREHLDTLIDRAFLFSGIHADLNHIDVSGIGDFSRLFANKQFEGSVAHWDVSGATNMSRMFLNSTFNGDLSRWQLPTQLPANAFDQFFAQMRNHSIVNLRLPSDLPAALAELCRDGMPDPLHDWLAACAKDPRRGLGRYHWDMVLMCTPLEGELVADWWTPEMQAHAAQWEPIHEGLGLSPLEAARSLHKQWLVRHNPVHACDALAIPPGVAEGEMGAQ